ncbi:Reverse transcriptase [Phytophthora palmivora]|uniref:Reverse transcriptase n=1 Tax=Phytophthora palmivora TaxID=4796 RepID=A0A2P4YTK0_9STRA|nr:Reverse transcriptase [Phytophthora palmivora]
MPFGLRTATQIYRRLLDSALYGFLKVNQDQDRSDRKDVFETAEPDLEKNEDVDLYRRYTGNRKIVERVEKLLAACDEWNLSISVAKIFWCRQNVDYLGHHVSAEGLEAHPKDLSALQELQFSTNLRSMHHSWGVSTTKADLVKTSRSTHQFCTSSAKRASTRSLGGQNRLGTMRTALQK